MKIAFFETEGWEKEYLEKKLAGSGHELLFTHSQLNSENAADFKEYEILSVFIGSKLTPEVLDKLPNLKFITTRSTGYDHIDCPTCHNRNILVSTVPHYGTHTVAEHTFALILGLTRKLYESIERTKAGTFDHKELTGFDLFDKTIGIVGLGDIGTSVLNIAKGFGMHVVAYSHHPDEAVAQKLSLSFLELKELFAISDIVTLHVPYTKENHHLVNRKNIKRFKKGSILINTARGALVETQAVAFALEKRILKGFGADVLEEEDIIQKEQHLVTEHYLRDANLKTLYLDHVLMGKPNVLITPHNAFNSIEALRLILDVTVDNIVHFTGQQPQNTV